MCQEDASNVIFRHRSDQFRAVLYIPLVGVIQVVGLHHGAYCTSFEYAH
jgi:hypothetical protein